MPELCVWTTDEEWVIAATPARAAELWAQHMDADAADCEADCWRQCEPEAQFTYYHPHGTEETHTFGEWTVLRGEGYFASADFG